MIGAYTRGLAVCFCLMPCRVQPVRGDGKVHAPLVFGTDAGGGIREGVASSRDLWMKVLFKAFDVDGRRHISEPTVLTDRDATQKRIYKYYSEFSSRPEDTLLFYCGGHGGMDPRNGHYLAISHGNVYRSKLRGAMIFQRHRLAVILTNCCAGFPGQEPPEPKSEAGARLGARELGGCQASLIQCLRLHRRQFLPAGHVFFRPDLD